MFILVLGGAACGKSEYAENRCVQLAAGANKLYIATMEPYGEDAAFRITRHRALRAEKGFDTLECYRDLAHAGVPSMGYHTILLECMSTLLANEFFSPDGKQHYADAILQGIAQLQQGSQNLVLISNKVFSDGIAYDADTMAYLHALAQLNTTLAQAADVVVELTCGIPRVLKGSI